MPSLKDEAISSQWSSMLLTVAYLDRNRHQFNSIKSCDTWVSGCLGNPLKTFPVSEIIEIWRAINCLETMRGYATIVCISESNGIPKRYMGNAPFRDVGYMPGLYFMLKAPANTNTKPVNKFRSQHAKTDGIGECGEQRPAKKVSCSFLNSPNRKRIVREKPPQIGKGQR